MFKPDIPKLLAGDWYHGTTHSGELRPSSTGAHGSGVYLTNSPKEASQYAKTHDKGNPQVHIYHPVVKNPYYVDNAAGENVYDELGVRDDAELLSKLKAKGYDSILAKMDDSGSQMGFKLPPENAVGVSYHLVVFDPKLIRPKFSRAESLLNRLRKLT